MRKNPVLREIEKLRDQLVDNRYLPVLILDSEAYEYIKPQLDSQPTKKGIRTITFQDGTKKNIKESTVIFIDDIGGEYDDA